MVPLCIPTNSDPSSLGSTFSPEFGVASVSDFEHSNRYVVISHFCSYLHFPDEIWCIASFYMPICHLQIFFGEISVKVYGPFFNRIVYFLIIVSSLFAVLLHHECIHIWSVIHIQALWRGKSVVREKSDFLPKRHILKSTYFEIPNNCASCLSAVSQTHPHPLKFCSKLMEMVSSEVYFSGSLDSWLPSNFGNRRHWKKISRKKRGNFMLLVPAVWQFPGNGHNISWAKVIHSRLRKEPFPFTTVPALTEVTFLCWNQYWL